MFERSLNAVIYSYRVRIFVPGQFHKFALVDKSALKEIPGNMCLLETPTGRQHSQFVTFITIIVLYSRCYATFTSILLRYKISKLSDKGKLKGRLSRILKFMMKFEYRRAVLRIRFCWKFLICWLNYHPSCAAHKWAKRYCFWPFVFSAP